MDDKWWEDAECRKHPWYMFETINIDTPIGHIDNVKTEDGVNRATLKGGDLSKEARMELNEYHFRHAEEVCIECPVFFQCKEDATYSDREYTVRAGEWPLGFVEDWKAWKSRKASGNRVCQRGHKVVGGGRCTECKLITTNERRRQRRKAKSDTL